jgi:hypothetical protein
VYAQLLANQPAARYGAAAAGNAGTMVVFGGTTAAGLKLSDVQASLRRQ